MPLTNADESVIDRFFLEAPKAWEKTYADYDGTEFEVDIVGHGVAQPNLKRVVSQFKGNFRIESISDLPSFNQVDLSNVDYQATVSKNLDGVWYIKNCNANARVSNDRFVIAIPSLRASVYHIPTYVHELGSYLENNETALVLKDAWQGTDANGDEIVTVEFLPGIRDDKGDLVVNESISNGYLFRVDFSPERSWCVVKVEVRIPAIRLSRKAIVIYSSEGTHPSEIQIFEGTTDENEPKLRYREVFSKLRSKSLDINQFRVSSFGLKEPTQFIRSRPKNWANSCLVVACLVGSYVIFRSFRNNPRT